MLRIENVPVVHVGEVSFKGRDGNMVKCYEISIDDDNGRLMSVFSTSAVKVGEKITISFTSQNNSVKAHVVK